MVMVSKNYIVTKDDEVWLRSKQLDKLHVCVLSLHLYVT